MNDTLKLEHFETAMPIMLPPVTIPDWLVRRITDHLPLVAEGQKHGPYTFAPTTNATIAYLLHLGINAYFPIQGNTD